MNRTQGVTGPACLSVKVGFHCGMQRVLQRELLDLLPETDPDAIRSRRDLCIINSLMGNHRWLLKTLRRHLRPGDHVVEIGAGEGHLAKRLNNMVSKPGSFRFTGLDRVACPPSYPRSFEWEQNDITSSSVLETATVVISCLTLHHFDGVTLQRIGRQMEGRARLILAVEPLRRRRHLWQLHFLRIFLINHVTRHDARASVQAGFLPGELAKDFGLYTPQWVVRENSTFFGGYRFTAERTFPASRPSPRQP